MDGAVAIILAAGAGERMGDGEPKAFLELAGRPMLSLAVEAACSCPAVVSAVVAVPAGRESRARAVLEAAKPVEVVAGGATRQGSVLAALAVVPEEASVVVCHDAARPFASAELFAAVLDALGEVEGAIPVVPLPDTVKRVRDGLVVGTEPRDGLVLAQTPQAFVARALREAHDRALRAGVEFTDDAAVLEWAGYRVGTVPGEPGNFKITTPDDLARAELLALEARRG